MNARADTLATTRWARLLAMAERRLPALTRLKQAEALPIALHRHRIYVLPTRFGLMFSAILAVMLLGALNYSNNPAMLLTCLLAAASYQSVFQAFRAVNRIELRSIKAEPCHAGDTLRLSVYFHIDARARHGLRLVVDGHETIFDLIPDDGTPVILELPAPQRGWRPLGRIRLFSEYPFGLFQVWSWLHPDFKALVYPQLDANPTPLPQAGGDTDQQARQRRGDELAMLRDYHASDPRRMIAWKASARHDSLLVKEFEQRHGREIVLDWLNTRSLSYEARISRLARWVMMAEAANAPYELRLPDSIIKAGLGPDHRDACLQALALMPGAAA